MNVVIYANCQGGMLLEFLEKVIRFESSNCLLSYSCFKDKVNLPIDILSKCDLFIYQPVDENHGIYNTFNNEGILKFLRKDCKKISFPSIYANIFPLYLEGNEVVGGESISKLKDRGNSLEEILNMYKNMSIDFNLRKRFLSSLNYMKEKEKFCDIILSDFIELNIKKFKIFDTQNHPNGTIMAYLSNKIFEILSVNHRFDINEHRQSLLPGSYGYSPYMGKELDIKYDDFQTDYTNIIVGLYNGNIHPKIKDYNLI
jgi:hypothetical protein